MKAADKKALERYKKKLNLIRSSGNINAYETEKEKNERIERAKKDVRFMVEYYFPHYATSECADFHVEWANKVKRNKEFIGFAKWGRGQAKSVWNNILIPYWLWLNGEQVYFVLIGQNEKKAQQLLEDLRAEFEANPRIINDFGEQKNLGHWEEGFFQTNSGFVGQALGLGQSCRGLRVGSLRPNYVNCDDLETKKTIKNQTIQDENVEWFEQELLGGMDGERERVTVSNNWFADKMFIRKLSERHPDWVVHEVVAYDPTTHKPTWFQKYKDDYFLRKEKKMGRASALAEYCHIVTKKGNIFKPDQIQWSKLPRLDHFTMIVSHWDVAYAGNPTSDYNAVRIWGLKDKQFHYITSFVKQTKMRAALDFMCEFQQMLPNSVIIHWQYEAQFWNDEVQRTIDEAQESHNVELNITQVPNPNGKKYDRILSLQSYYQNGRIWYNEKMKSHVDTQTGLNQLYAFGPGSREHDDAPDSDHQCITFLSRHIPMGSGKTVRRTGKYTKTKNHW